MGLRHPVQIESAVMLHNNVTECYRMLQNVTECYRMLQNVTECYRMFQNVTECYRMLQNITTNLHSCYIRMLHRKFGHIENRHW